MISVKVSIQGISETVSFSQFTESGTNVVEDVVFHINEDVGTADVWLVMEGPCNDTETCVVPDGALIHLTCEPARQVGYLVEAPGLPQFMRQFDHFYTCLDFADFRGRAAPPFLPWMINGNHGAGVYAPHDRNFSALQALDVIPKTKVISVFCSTQAVTANHRMRLRFVELLASHFGERLDWFGNGLTRIDAKWDGLAPYRYTVVLENQSTPYVITERLSDAFLSLTFPIYWGAPNVGMYFPRNSFTPVDIRDPFEAIAIIEDVLEEDPYPERLKSIREARDVVLKDFNFVNRMAQIATFVSRNSTPSRQSLRRVNSISNLARKSTRTRLATQLDRAGNLCARSSRWLSM